jgi:hypothetical protein
MYIYIGEDLNPKNMNEKEREIKPNVKRQSLLGKFLSPSENIKTVGFHQHIY